MSKPTLDIEKLSPDERLEHSLLYRLVGDEVIVVACFHGKRDPRRWHDRT